MCGHRGWWPLTYPPMLVTLDGHHCFLGVSRPYPNLKPSLSCVLMSPEASWSHCVGLSLDESGGLSASLWVRLSGSHWASFHVALSRLGISLVHLSLWFLILCLCLFVSSSLSLVKTGWPQSQRSLGLHFTSVSYSGKSFNLRACFCTLK